MTAVSAGPAPAMIDGIDGIDVEMIAAAVRRCAGVSALDGGPYGEVATYLPGRKVAGVVIGEGQVTVQVRAAWGVPAPELAALITTVVSPLAGHRLVDVVIADIDDPPRALGQPWPDPGLPPV
jgi:hypothetical protein